MNPLLSGLVRLRVTLLATAFACLATVCTAQFDGGTGTPQNPYIISTIAQLDAVRSNLSASFVLANDLDLSGSSFQPIGSINEPFSGTFNGASHAVSNWTHTATTEYAGLISATTTDAKVINLQVTNAQLSTEGSVVAILVGLNNGQIVNCHATGSVVGGGSLLGGLVAINAGTVSDSSAAVSVTASSTSYSSSVGGLVASNYVGSVVRCSTSGSVSVLADSSDAIGGLVGYASGGSIVGCTSTASVVGGADVGGLVGYSDGQIIDCSASGQAVGQSQWQGNIGGLVGRQIGPIRNCYSRASVISAASPSGGLVGYLGASVKNSYATGPVSGPGAGGGLIGIAGSGSSADNCYWDLETSGISTSALGSGKTTAQMQEPGTYSAWDLINIWSAPAGQYPTLQSGAPSFDATPSVTFLSQSRTVYAGTMLYLAVRADGAQPLSFQWFRDGIAIDGATNANLPVEGGAPGVSAFTVRITNALGSIWTSAVNIASIAAPAFAGGNGSVESPFQIANRAQLEGVRRHLRDNFVLTADLDLEGAIFEPIGSPNDPFTGRFDGANHTISKWTYHVPPELSGDTFAGFFRTAGGSSRIYNLQISQAIVTNAGGYVGLLVGSNEGTLYNCSTSGYASGVMVGGLVASNTGTVIQCRSDANVGDPGFTSGVMLGGLVAFNRGNLTDCSAAGMVEAGVNAQSQSGGLVGQNDSVIERCYATGPVDGGLGLAGGLVGRHNGTIKFSFANNTVSAAGAGGLVGYMVGGTLFDSYAATQITGTSAGGLIWQIVKGSVARCYAVTSPFAATGPNTGGLVGGVFGSATIADSYWDISVSGIAISARGTGKSTSEMQSMSPYINWDFGNVWSLATGEYPQLRIDAPLVPMLALPLVNQEVAEGGTVTFTAFATGGQLAYQWYFNGQVIAGAQGSSYTISDAQASNTGPYSVIVTNPLGSATSFAGLSVYTPSVPVIDTQPESKDALVGDSVAFFASARGGPAPHYQWQRNGVDIEGFNTQVLVLNNVQLADTGDYTVVVSNPLGIAISASAHLSVAEPLALTSVNPDAATSGGTGFALSLNGTGFVSGATVLWDGSPRATTFLSSTSLSASVLSADLNTSTALTVAAVSVQNPNGATTPAIALPIVSTNVVEVQSVATAANTSSTVSTVPTAAGEAGATTTLTNNSSVPVTVSVANYASNPSSVPTIDVGGKYVDVQIVGAGLSDTATSYFYYPSTITDTTESGLILQYFDGAAWQPVLSHGGQNPDKNTTDDLDGSTSGGRFIVVFDSTSTPRITDLTGTFFTIAPPAPSSPTKHKPKIQTQPLDQTTVAGNSVSFTVAVESSGATSYQWFFGKKGSVAIAGATRATLILSTASTSDAGEYFVVVTNSKGSVTSSKAELVVLPPPPTVVTQPLAQRVSAGAAVIFSVSATGETSLSYQWYLNGKKIGGASTATLSIRNASTADAGTYTVNVSNAGGTVTSAPAALQVDRPSITGMSPSEIVAGSRPFSLVVNGSGFASDAQVSWNGKVLPTHFVDSSTITADVSSKEIPAAKKSGKLENVEVTVVASSGDISNVKVLRITP